MAAKEKVKLNKYQKWFRFLHFVHAVVYRPLFPYKRYGHTELFDDRAYLFVCNHRSNLDVVLVAMSTSYPVHFLAKNSLFKSGIVKWFCLKSQAIPVNRDGNDVKAIVQAVKCLRANETVGIFPEGTRNRTKEQFLPFKSGASTIAIKTHTPVVPMVIFKKPGFMRKAHIYLGQPFEFSEFYDRKLTEEVIEESDKILWNKMNEQYALLADIVSKKGKKKK